MASDEAQPEPQPGSQPLPEISKKGAKKAEAKAKKEAEKARRQAEREAAEAAKNKDAIVEDAARDHYGDVDDKLPPMNGKRTNLRSLGKEHVGTSIVVRAWIQNARSQRCGRVHSRQLAQS